MTLPRAGGEPRRDDARRGFAVVVVAGSPALRAGLAALLGTDPDLVVVSDPFVADAEPPDAVVVDLGSGGGPEASAEAWPGTPLVLLGADAPLAGAALADGPVGYLPADADAASLVAAVRAVVAGLTVVDPTVAGLLGLQPRRRAVEAGDLGDPLSPRELQVLALVADGLPNKAIARELGISEHTAKFHVGSVLGKLGAGSRTEAVTLATRRGILAV